MWSCSGDRPQEPYYFSESERRSVGKPAVSAVIAITSSSEIGAGIQSLERSSMSASSGVKKSNFLELHKYNGIFCSQDKFLVPILRCDMGHNNDNAAVKQNGHSEISSSGEQSIEKNRDYTESKEPNGQKNGLRTKMQVSAASQMVADPTGKTSFTMSDVDEKPPLTTPLSLRHVLSDPITGSFLEDAMVANCGHSFGGAGLKRVNQTNVCLTCGASIAADSLVPNYALRAAVSAYQQQALSPSNFAKRKRDQTDEPENSECKKAHQDQLNSSENTVSEGSRPKGVQFPFSVNDHVLIKGNKRTPERFFGREAIISSQCLNGWYLVKTLDDGESIRLQYRSLQKVEDGQLSSESLSSQEVAKAPDEVKGHSSAKSFLEESPLNDQEKTAISSAASVLVKTEVQLVEADTITKNAGLAKAAEALEGDNADKEYLNHDSKDGTTPLKAGTFALKCKRSSLGIRSQGTSFNYRKPGSVSLSPKNNHLPEIALAVEGTSQTLAGRKRSPSPKLQHVAMKDSNDPLRVVRREMLHLERSLPWNFLSLSWKERRIQWRSKVRQSTEVKDLGLQVHDFRLHLLLDSAGGLSDEEWQKQLAAAVDFADIKSLALLWKKLNEDVHKLLDSKAEALNRDKTQQLELGEVHAAFPHLRVEGMSLVSVIAATILASADAIARGDNNAHEILEVPMKLIQQHGRQELASIREALEREKRHIIARLSHVGEDDYSKLQHKGSKAEPKTSIHLATSEAAGIQKVTPTNLPSETEKRDADGEATDMSDSDS